MVAESVRDMLPIGEPVPEPSAERGCSDESRVRIPTEQLRRLVIEAGG